MMNLDDVKQVLADAGEHTLTLFLNVSGATPENQATNSAWRIWLNNTMRDLPATLSKEQAAHWDDIRDQVELFARGYEPSSRGLVLFAAPNYLRAYELPLNFENSATFGLPQVAPLLWAMDEFEPYLIVLVDQEKARFFVSQLGNVGFEHGIEIDTDEYDFRERTTMHGPGPGIDNAAVHGGTGRDDHEKMLDEHRARFFRDVIAQAEKLMTEHNARRLILGGAEQSAHAVKNLMSEQTLKSLVDVLNIPLRANLQEIYAQAQPVAEAYERQQEIDIVQQIIDMAKARGRGALGLNDVQTALDMQRVELLVLVWPLHDEAAGVRLVQQAISLNSKIELVHGEAAMMLGAEGGVGARLYYAL